MSQNKKKRLRRSMTALMAMVLVAGIAAGCGKKDEEGAAAPETPPAASTTPPASTDAGQPGDVLVTYKDGGKVTREEFDKFVNINLFFNPQYAQFKDDAGFRQDMMKQLVTFKVLSGRADDKAKAEGEKQSKEQYEQIKMVLSAQEGGLEQKLKDANITEPDVQDFVTRSLTAIVSEENKVTDEQTKKVYDEKLATDKNAYDIATVSHILIGTQDPATGQSSRTKEEALKRAKEVVDKLAAGGDFAALAKEYSEDPGSKDNGGTYENAEISQWVPEFKKAAAELPIGKVSDPVETDYGYHVMKVASRSTKTYDEVKTSLKSEAAQTNLYAFVEKELPGLIETNNLPKPEETPAPQTPAADAPAADAPAAEAPKTDAAK